MMSSCCGITDRNTRQYLQNNLFVGSSSSHAHKRHQSRLNVSKDSIHHPLIWKIISLRLNTLMRLIFNDNLPERKLWVCNVVALVILTRRLRSAALPSLVQSAPDTRPDTTCTCTCTRPDTPCTCTRPACNAIALQKKGWNRAKLSVR